MTPAVGAEKSVCGEIDRKCSKKGRRDPCAGRWRRVRSAIRCRASEARSLYQHEGCHDHHDGQDGGDPENLIAPCVDVRPSLLHGSSPVRRLSIFGRTCASALCPPSLRWPRERLLLVRHEILLGYRDCGEEREAPPLGVRLAGAIQRPR